MNKTIPGIGKIKAVAILAESPDIDHFNSARELAAYAGLTPKHKISGTSVKEKASILKDRFLQATKSPIFSSYCC